MIDDKTIKSIIANGGWCIINYRQEISLKDQLNGRILFNGSDYLIINRFNLRHQSLDGFYLFYKPNIKKLGKEYWIKKYLTVGGKVINDVEIPKNFICSNWLELLSNLQSTFEPLKFNLISSYLLGQIKEYTPEEIKVKESFTDENNANTAIRMASLICIEARTHEILHMK
jgi:hypothetical protein